jgi:inner membrane protein
LDPIAHTLTGTALAAAGLRRVTPLATAALVIGANIPDLDVVAYAGGAAAALEHRRGWTHGVLAIVLWPAVVAALLLSFDRLWRLKRDPGAARARAGPLLAVAAIGVITHPLLDWLNNYGMRWLMPFDGTWFYGDALFIIDPWVWLALGAVSFFAFSSRPMPIALWLLLFSLLSWLVLTNALVPPVARAIWVAGLAGVVALRLSGVCAPARPLRVARGARLALGIAGIYLSVSLLANIPARAEVRTELAALGISRVGAVMIGPVPANPFAGSVIATDGERYYLGSWRWFGRPRFVPADRVIERGLDGAEVEAALVAREARRYLVWSRFPFAEVERLPRGFAVRFRDARYVGTGTGLVSGPTIRLDESLRIVSSP